MNISREREESYTQNAPFRTDSRSTILYEVDSFVAYVTLNREKNLNAVNSSMLARLAEVVGDIKHNKQVRAVVFSGAGKRAFSVGKDLQERRESTPQQAIEFNERLNTVLNAIESLPQPTIAAINGYAFGLGLELALACDFRIGIEQTLMGFTEAGFGLIPGGGGTQRLPRLIGESKALELILTAKRISSAEAHSYGLLTKAAAKNIFDEVCQDFVKLLLENAPIAVQQAKYAVKQGMKESFQQALQIEERAFHAAVFTEDSQEALDAYMEKRKPVFRAK
ncbi:enoyl-CoA hydratase/carnithine racemase [Peribacillus deserti]|uniref:Enoyl-CoA hydratase/carnithine racemase n=1 Tax=Peribacillus deserti TaxID=673318 RepID=A0ABS2QLG8_9BACI|nr:enoyl-CoA hydratase-related protein [Peribacillus deserti]MBM7694023.1 enoyl-CoA hydratase/carnithine racemase [Peribacillus deserti]